MGHGVQASVHRRDRALALLNDLTVAIAIGAAGLLGTFAIIAAATIPGQSGTVLASTGTPANTTNTGSGLTGGFSGGQSGFQGHDHSVSQGGSSTPIVVTGGSR